MWVSVSKMGEETDVAISLISRFHNAVGSSFAESPFRHEESVAGYSDPRTPSSHANYSGLRNQELQTTVSCNGSITWCRNKKAEAHVVRKNEACALPL